MSAPRWAHPVAGWRSGVTLDSQRFALVPSRTIGPTPRFRVARLATAMVMAWLAIAVAFVPLPERARAATAVTTVNLNLRSGPGTNYSILTVMPAGAYVEITGKAVNDFYPVSFEGAAGFAAAQFISTDSSWTGNNGGGSSGSATGTATVTTALNLRAGAGTNYQILNVMPSGATVELLGEQQNGFLHVSYQGQTGWAHGDFLRTGGGSSPEPTSSEPTTPSNPTTNGPTGTASTTASLNLRASASLSAAVLTVMPYGATVQLLGPQQNNFAQVSYGSLSGWASLDYLDVGGGGQQPAPTPTPPPAKSEPSTGAPQGQVWATTSLNFRSGPGTSYSVLAVIPYGGSGTTDGRVQNGFWALTYNGVSGWAASDYLTTTPISYSPPPATNNPGSGNGGGSGYTEQEIIQIIYDAADRYGQPREDMLRVARCESLLDPKAVNVAGSSYGLFQFIPSTWATTPYASYDIFDPWASANAAGWMWSVGRRNEWVCQ